MINPKQWEIWWASFVFEDNPNEVKQRPVLVLDNQTVFPVLVAKATVIA